MRRGRLSPPQTPHEPPLTLPKPPVASSPQTRRPAVHHLDDPLNPERLRRQTCGHRRRLPIETPMHPAAVVVHEIERELTARLREGQRTPERVQVKAPGSPPEPPPPATATGVAQSFSTERPERQGGQARFLENRGGTAQNGHRPRLGHRLPRIAAPPMSMKMPTAARLPAHSAPHCTETHRPMPMTTTSPNTIFSDTLPPPSL